MDVTTVVAVILTFMVWSYVLGDNPAFRVAEHLLVGTSIGFAVLVAWFNVVKPAFFLNGSPQLTPWSAIPLAFCLLLLVKLHPAPISAGNLSVGFLVGVGAALAVGGALFGTLIPQAMATAKLPFRASDADGKAVPLWIDPLFWQNVTILIGTVGTFLYFSFVRQRPGSAGGFGDTMIRFWRGVGHWIVVMTLGALFANAAMSYFTLFVGRVQWLLDAIGVVGY